jgi:hypothetical protein
MIQIEKTDLKSAIRFGLGSQGIWTPELENILIHEITQLAYSQSHIKIAERNICPICKKEFKKGWGEFCSQDCWDTDM